MDETDKDFVKRVAPATYEAASELDTKYSAKQKKEMWRRIAEEIERANPR